MFNSRLAFCLLLFGIAAAQPAAAQADRESLLAAWEQLLASQPATQRFEATGDETYRLVDTDLPYTGELRLIGALVRRADVVTAGNEFTHMGIVEFELSDLPAERLGSQSFYYWLADRQTLHYSAADGRWVDAATYMAALSSGGAYARRNSNPVGGFRMLSFMLNYGIWAVLIALIAFVFLLAQRQGRRARALMDDTADINRRARENLDRAAKMQDQVLAVSRESRDLQAETNRLLTALLDDGDRRPPDNKG